MKMNRGFLKRSISAALVFAMTAVLFTGCGKKNDNSGDLVNQVSQGSKDYVFAQEMIDIESGVDLSRIMYNGDKVFVSAFTSDGSTDLYSFYSDGSDFRKTTLDGTDNKNFSFFTMDKDSNIYAVYYIYHWSDYYDEEEASESDASEEGSLDDAADQASAEVTENEETDAAGMSDESAEEASAEDNARKMVVEEQQDDECYLAKFDWEGNLIYQVDLMAEYGDEDNYLSVSGMILTDDNELVLSINSGLYKYSENAGFTTLLKPDENASRYYQLFKGFEGKVFVLSYGDQGMELCQFDTKTGKMGEPSSLFTGYPDYSFFGGNGYDLYCCKKDGVYGIDFEKNELTKLLDFVDSDIEITSSTGMMVGISDVEFVSLVPDMDYNFYAARFTKIPADQVVDKTIITMGGYYMNYDIRKKAFEFNKENPNYKIKFVDYSSYDDEGEYGAGIEKMNMDIVSGNTPDILVLSYDMPVDSYINKGLFYDMSGYLNNDSDISNVELLTNVLDALRTGDKLYQITPSFTIGSMVVKTKFTEGKDVLTFKDCKELMEKTGVKKEVLFGNISRETFLSYGLNYSGNNYIDWANKSCSFNSDSFVEFLEFANGFPETYEYLDMENYKDSLYHEDESLFNIVTISNVRSYAFMRYLQFGEDISFVGYPNDMGVNNSVIIPDVRLAISAQSQNKDAAWEFVSSLLMEDYQDKIDYSFPIRKSSFEKKAEECSRKPYFMDGTKKIEYDDTYYMDGVPVNAPNLTSEDILFMTNFIKSVTMLSSNNTSVNNIINEEASAFFSGQKGAKEVADIIQSRLSIYVNENS